MNVPSAETIAARLREANAAHGEYETTVLNGVYDQEWAAWYANYLADRGFIEMLAIPEIEHAEHIAAYLSRFDIDYRREQPAVDWPEFYALRFVALRNGDIPA